MVTRTKSVRTGDVGSGLTPLYEALLELARKLQPRGITPKIFSQLARYAFTHAAADTAKLGNGRVNYSRVAAQTGLTRAEVKRILGSTRFTIHDQIESPLVRVIKGWRSDPEFGGRKGGQPKHLESAGQRSAFARLVKKYGGDIPHRAILEELRSIGAIHESGTTVELLQLRAHMRLSGVPDALRVTNRPRGPRKNVLKIHFGITEASPKKVGRARLRRS